MQRSLGFNLGRASRATDASGSPAHDSSVLRREPAGIAAWGGSYRQLLWLLLAVLPACPHPGRDISPNRINGTVQGTEASPAGLTYELAGTDHALYAVSLDAGVWKSVDGGAWRQLAASPRWAATIAVDPADDTHVVVGEREGDATPIAINRSGLWESRDGGETWTFVFSALSQPACRARSQSAIHAVFFTPARTLLIGTPCGVGRRLMNGTGLDFRPSPADVASVKAFAVSGMERHEHEPLLWARAERSDGRTVILSSERDGTGWQTSLVPPNVDGYEIGLSYRGDDYTIAAFGETAVLGFRPKDASDPARWPPNSNFNTLLYFQRDRSAFRAQALLGTGDGTGCGGRKRLRSFVHNFLSPTSIGSAVDVFYLAGNDAFVATSLDGTGNLVFRKIACSACAGCNGVPESIHNDFWDVHMTAAARTVRISTDGGVFRQVPDGWRTQNDGLHTQHAHTCTALAGAHGARLAYVTTDNSEWVRPDRSLSPPFEIGKGNWTTYNRTGDGKFTAGDVANPAAAVISRAGGPTFFTSFGQPMPAGAKVVDGQGFAPLCLAVGGGCSELGFGGQRYKVIQTLPFEAVEPLLDVVALVDAPLTAMRDGRVQPVTGAIGHATSATGGPLLIRNRKWLAGPDVNTTQYAGWEMVANDLPVGAVVVSVSGGHAKPVYYVVATNEGMTTAWRHADGVAGWTRLDAIGAPIVSPTYHAGPLFANPFDPDHVMILTTDGVRVAKGLGAIGAATPFALDPVLSALVTRSGVFPFPSIAPGRCEGAVHCSMAFDRNVVGDVAFRRGLQPGVVVVAPLAGVYYGTGDGTWRTLDGWLPRPFTMPSSAAILGDDVFVSFEGRGLWHISRPQDAPLGCWFARRPQTPREVMLVDGQRQPIANAPVVATVVQDGVATPSTIKADGSGTLLAPGASGQVVELRFDGDGKRGVGACQTSIVVP
jgi:hypothetical protein